MTQTLVGMAAVTGRHAPPSLGQPHEHNTGTGKSVVRRDQGTKAPPIFYMNLANTADAYVSSFEQFWDDTSVTPTEYGGRTVQMRSNLFLG